jgi:hypothetical protein
MGKEAEKDHSQACGSSFGKGRPVPRLPTGLDHGIAVLVAALRIFPRIYH